MHVVATAGHVDHGKSTLVRALTGMEPDRWAEERRRGMTIDLGFAWTQLPSGEQLAFVDVPGHERFIANMLAGVGPAPAVMLVVAADEGWMPQTEEHLQAAVALGTTRVLLVVTKCDLAPPEPVRADALARLEDAGLTGSLHVAVSGSTGHGLDDLRRVLGDLVRALPRPDTAAPVRLWIDRAFTITGAGTVVTGTLAAGSLSTGDTLELAPAGRMVTVRALQSMQSPRRRVEAVARVAVNLRGVDHDEVARGMALLTARAWTHVSTVDVCARDAESVGRQLVVHIGSAAVAAQARRLGPGAWRLRLRDPLPLHLGDRLLLRDPASRHVAGADVADLRPPPLRRRGAAAAVAAHLRVPASATEELARRGVCTVQELAAAGLDTDPDDAVRLRDTWVSQSLWAELGERLAAAVDQVPPLSAGLPLAELARDLGLPDGVAVIELARGLSGVEVAAGRVRPHRAGPQSAVADALVQRLASDPFRAPDAAELAALGLGPAELAHAVRAGQIARIADGVYLSVDAPQQALHVLSGLPQPFTVSDARVALASTRRVVVPLLELLDAARDTRKLPDGTRLVVLRQA